MRLYATGLAIKYPNPGGASGQYRKINGSITQSHQVLKCFSFLLFRSWLTRICGGIVFLGRRHLACAFRKWNGGARGAGKCSFSLSWLARSARPLLAALGLQRPTSVGLWRAVMVRSLCAYATKPRKVTNDTPSLSAAIQVSAPPFFLVS